jgi:hypothetical protein
MQYLIFCRISTSPHRALQQVSRGDCNIMPPHHPPIPKAPEPTKIFFDPFNSSSTGHQHAKNRLSGSTSWAQSRSFKLSHQYRDLSGGGGSKHLADLVGPGSENFGKDGRKENGDWEKGAPGLREEGWQDIRSFLGPMEKRKSTKAENEDHLSKRTKSETPISMSEEQHTQAETDQNQGDLSESADRLSSSSCSPKPQIFRSLTIYLNGSTAPLISDHKLKHLFAQHGGNISIALGRRKVTHIIVGDSCGGGLASGKIEKEVSTVRGKGIKFITVQWVLDSVEKGIRQPESRYAPKNLDKRIGGAGQGGVREMFETKPR